MKQIFTLWNCHLFWKHPLPPVPKNILAFTSAILSMALLFAIAFALQQQSDNTAATSYALPDSSIEATVNSISALGIWAKAPCSAHSTALPASPVSQPVCQLTPSRDLNTSLLHRYKERELNGLDQAQCLLYSTSTKTCSKKSYREFLVNVSANTLQREGIGFFHFSQPSLTNRWLLLKRHNLIIDG